MCNLGHQRVIGVGVREHGADGEKYYYHVSTPLFSERAVRDRQLFTFADCESGTPLVSQNVQADAAVGVDVGMVNTGGEVDLGGLERVVCREVDGQEEDAARVWRVALSITD